ncbi:DUF5989 family protein [Candidatus Pelagibacter ubique]|nr:DUF5989 family protein [Candidatus Pelagibacter ubique]
MSYVSNLRIKPVIGFYVMNQYKEILLDVNSKKYNTMELLKELWTFLRVRKKLWLAPIIIIMIIFGGLLILAQGSVIAPFVYTIF